MSYELEPQATRSIPQQDPSLRRGLVGRIAAAGLMLPAAAALVEGAPAIAGEIRSGVEATQTIDGKEFERFEGDTSAKAYERMEFQSCWDSAGHTSYVDLKVTPDKLQPFRRGVLKAARTDISAICDGYIQREISGLSIKTRVSGSKRWKTGKISVEDVNTLEGKSRTTLGKIDWGQRLPRNKEMDVKVIARTEVINTTSGMEDIAVGETSAASNVLDTKKVSR